MKVELLKTRWGTTERLTEAEISILYPSDRNTRILTDLPLIVSWCTTDVIMHNKSG